MRTVAALAVFAIGSGWLACAPEGPTAPPPPPGPSTITLAWDPPDSDAEGDPLTDLAGFRLYHAAGSPIALLRSVPSELGMTSSTTLRQLPPGVHYVAISAVDDAGNESALSEMLEVRLPLEETGSSATVAFFDDDDEDDDGDCDDEDDDEEDDEDDDEEDDDDEGDDCGADEWDGSRSDGGSDGSGGADGGTDDSGGADGSSDGSGGSDGGSDGSSGSDGGSDGSSGTDGGSDGSSGTDGSGSSDSGDSTPPRAPVGLIGEAVTSSQVDLSWRASSDPETGVDAYHVYRGNRRIGTTSGLEFSDVGLAPEVTYSYRVRAVNGAGLVGPSSRVATVTTPAAEDRSPPSVPAGLEASAASTTQVNLSWEAAEDPESGIESYRIYRDGEFLLSTSTTLVADTGLSPDTEYVYAVTAVNGSGVESARTPEIRIRTPAEGDFVAPAPPRNLRVVSR